MTLVVAWIRKIRRSEHLIVAADTRLTGGQTWDCCPKIFPLDRGDSVICFAGDTLYAYPIILQVQAMINMHNKTANRATDIAELQQSISKVMNQMLDYRSDFPSCGPENPDVKFLFAGYSWRLGSYQMWLHEFSVISNSFEYRNAGKQLRKREYPCLFLGDCSSQAKIRLTQLMDSKRKRVGPRRLWGRKPNLDMEPLSILKNYVTDINFTSIGGSIQLVKVYKHLNIVPFNVIWPKKNGTSTDRVFLGRPLLEYEKNLYLTIDPMTNIVTDPWGHDNDLRHGGHLHSHSLSEKRQYLLTLLNNLLNDRIQRGQTFLY